MLPLLLGFIIGACVGSFVGCALYRLPRGISLVHGRSACPACQKTLMMKELLPIFSFLRQKGRCSCKKVELSPTYFMAELICGIGGALIAFFIIQP